MAGESDEGRGPAEGGVSVPPPPPDQGDNVQTYLLIGNYGSLPLSGPVSEEHLKTVTRQYAIKGALFTVAGVVAIIFPFFFGLAVEQLLAWLLVFGGGITLVQGFISCGAPGTASFILLGILHFGVGVWLLVRPLQGITALTLILSAWFFVHGILKIIMTWQVRHMRSWPAILASGIVSIALGVLIVWLTPTYGLKLLGIVFGADLIATGVSVLVIALIAYLHRGSLTRGDVESGSTREPLLEDNPPQ